MTKMQQGRGGIGSHKHGISGRAGKSPAFRHWMKRESEKITRKRRTIVDWKNSVRELFKSK